MPFTIDAAVVIDCLTRLTSKAWLGPWVAAVGEREKAAIEHRIRESKADPDERFWDKWQPATEAKRRRKGNIERGLLWDEGNLLGAPTYLTPLIGSSPGAVLEIGVDAAYGKFLQEGTIHMVARPFLGWTQTEMAWIESSMVAAVEAALV